MSTNQVKSETAKAYSITARSSGDDVIQAALEILQARVEKAEKFESSGDTKRYLALRAAGLEHEVFSVMFLNNKNHLIAIDDMFRGTIDGAAVYPREIVKAALGHNAAAVLFTHNHPSGLATPSQADIIITRKLKKALELVEIRVLDHLVTGGADVVSLAEMGLL